MVFFALRCVSLLCVTLLCIAMRCFVFCVALHVFCVALHSGASTCVRVLLFLAHRFVALLVLFRERFCALRIFGLRMFALRCGSLRGVALPCASLIRVAVRFLCVSPCLCAPLHLCGYECVVFCVVMCCGVARFVLVCCIMVWFTFVWYAGNCASLVCVDVCIVCGLHYNVCVCLCRFVVAYRSNLWM